MAWMKNVRTSMKMLKLLSLPNMMSQKSQRQRFRSSVVPVGETGRVTYNRLKGLYCRWMRSETKTKEEIAETLILEQYLRVLCPDVRTWVKEDQPPTGEERPNWRRGILQPTGNHLGPTRFQAKGLQPLHNLYPDLTEGGKKVRKDKKQRRWDKHVGKARVQDPVPVAPNPETTLLDPQWQVPDNFKELQRSDPLLQPLFAKVCKIDGVPVKQAPLIGDKYILIDNLLYIADNEVPRLVVPKSLHPLILYLGHHIQWAGYLGQQKSYDIISQRFYWPRLYQDVQEYCRTCTDCQKKVAPVRKSDRGLLQPLPIFGTPFERLGMDIIGPLVKSSSGHRFALVICNYTTRYPEVYPLLSIQVKHVVLGLIDLISRVGVPTEIITDQGTNFMSKLMKTLYRQLGITGITGIRTTPYHLQNGRAFYWYA
ncbi:protein NYNRIN-like [Acanthopagrus schlegelii]